MLKRMDLGTSGVKEQANKVGSKLTRWGKKGMENFNCKYPKKVLSWFVKLDDAWIDGFCYNDAQYVTDNPFQNHNKALKMSTKSKNPIMA